jgi:hypothetical protein
MEDSNVRGYQREDSNVRIANYKDVQFDFLELQYFLLYIAILHLCPPSSSEVWYAAAKTFVACRNRSYRLIYLLSFRLMVEDKVTPEI